MRIWALVGTSMLALSSVAQAQTSSDQASRPAQVPQTPDQQAGPETPPETAAENGGVGDIVVTANRREERLQDVPVAVTLVDGAQLTRQNVNAVEDLVRTAPALNAAGPAGFGALSIRGIGNLSFSASSEGSVGVVVDGVSLANTSTTPPLLFDIERVEVLEGPQGMLFGRNASAGVINIVTKAPDPSKMEVIGHADIGSRENYIARGAFNLPVGQNAALRVTGSYSQDPRVQRNLPDNTYIQREAKSARARFLWEPSSTLTLNLSGDYTDTDTQGGAPWGVYVSTPGSLLTSRLTSCGVTIGPKNADGCVGIKNFDSKLAYGFSGQIDLALGGANLTSITAYRATESDNVGDVDSTIANRLVNTNAGRIRNFSQELRLSSIGSGPIQYVAGLYYFDGRVRTNANSIGQVLADLPLINACPLPAAFLCTLPLGQARSTRSQTESYAAFSQITISATDRLRFILGGRVGREKVRAASTASVTAAGAVAQFAPAPAIAARAADTYFIYRAGAQYDVSKDLMVFGTYTRGYKGPAVNDAATSLVVPLIVRPEIPKSGEIGFKATLANGRAAFNVTAFYTKVNDFQAQFFDPAVPAFIFGNAPSLTSKGVTANLFGRPFKGLTANIGFTYNDATYGRGYLSANAVNAVVDADGNQLSSKFKATASTEYSSSIGNNLDGFIQADVVYRSRTFNNAANDAILSVDGAAIFGGRIGLRTTDGQIGVSVFARNIFDTFRPSSRFATPAAAQQLDAFSFSQFAGPESYRTIGASLDFKF